MLRFAAKARRLAGVVAERWERVGGEESMVERVGSELFRPGWLKTEEVRLDSVPLVLVVVVGVEV